MDDKLEKQLVDKYPALYRQYHESETSTCMCWGFECGDGWYDIIDRLSEQLKDLGIEACQVKQKYGGLRFYYDIVGSKYDRDKVEQAIRNAEEEADKTCEICGKPGKIKTGGWLQIICKGCDEINQKD